MVSSGFKLEEVKREQPLNYKIYQILKSQILEGNLQPGTKLIENTLSEQLGVSRTPIREAIKQLVAESFVKTIPGHGTFVNNVSIEDLKEVLEVRGALEGLAVKLVIKNIKEKEIKELEEILWEMQKYSIEKDLVSFSKCSSKFQALILEISKNNLLIRMRKNICDRSHRYRIISLSSPKRLKYSFEEHQAIFEAIKEKNSEKAERLCQIHTENVFKNIIMHIKKNESVDQK